MPEHLDAITTITRDMFYCILASKLQSQKNKKNKNLPPDHKISEKRILTNFFFVWPNTGRYRDIKSPTDNINFEILSHWQL